LAIPVYVEVGTRRVFASAIDWPGWTRAGKTEVDALAALETYARRYAPVAKQAGLSLPAPDFKVVERVKGNATTEFGAPAMPTKADSERMTRAQADRLCALLEASWKTFDAVAAKAPASLRKGPRGGGRDRDKMVDHVLGAEAGYQRQIGLKTPQPERGDTKAIKAFRAAILEALRGPSAGLKWPPQYMIRRMAWHALDHAWEIEDRS
jgi:hypothetical protein